MSTFSNVVVDRGQVTGTVEKGVDVGAATLTFTNREEGMGGALKVNLSEAFFFSERGSILSYGGLRDNCMAMASDYGFNQYVLA